ncbi:MAG: aminoacyl-tRNA deacylase [Planctomycetota bacterium]|jgi:Ala-tRNA(Pro) deacylase
MKVSEYLKDKGVYFSMHEHSPAYTAQEVAAEEHVSGKMLAKTVIVRVDDRYVMCVLPASLKLDMTKVAKAVKGKSVRLADETEMAKLFPDVEVGAEPPFGNLYEITTLVDEHLAADEEIVFQAGSHRQAIRMKYADYESLAEPQVADLASQL